MIRFENAEVHGWAAALRGMRNPLKSWDRADTIYRSGETPIIGANDYSLAMKLSKAGDGHDKFLRYIDVAVDITAPVFWWAEMDTFKVATVRNSTSMMHKGTAKHYTLDDFSFEDVIPCQAEALVTLINSYVDKYKEDNDIIFFRALREIMPMGFTYRSTWHCNYAVLKNIYKTRKNHRLSEWREFCDWIERLPYSELITEA